MKIYRIAFHEAVQGDTPEARTAHYSLLNEIHTIAREKTGKSTIHAVQTHDEARLARGIEGYNYKRHLFLHQNVTHASILPDLRDAWHGQAGLIITPCQSMVGAVMKTMPEIKTLLITTPEKFRPHLDDILQRMMEPA